MHYTGDLGNLMFNISLWSLISLSATIIPVVKIYGYRLKSAVVKNKWKLSFYFQLPTEVRAERLKSWNGFIPNIYIYIYFIYIQTVCIYWGWVRLGMMTHTLWMFSYSLMFFFFFTSGKAFIVNLDGNWSALIKARRGELNLKRYLSLINHTRYKATDIKEINIYIILLNWYTPR